MATENQVYFPLTGTESHGFIRVRLFEEAGTMQSEATLAGPMTVDADSEGLPMKGEPGDVLRDASDLAGLRGLDLRVELDGVEWDPELGALVDPDQTPQEDQSAGS